MTGVQTCALPILSDGTNSTSTTNAIQGSAKVWVNFNGSTSPGTIRASYNVSSVTKNGTGDWTINFTNSLTDTNYCYNMSSGQQSVSWGICTLATTSPFSTSSFRMQTITSSGTALDNTYISVAIFR